MRQVKRFTRKIGRGGRYDSLTTIQTESISSGANPQDFQAFMDRYAGEGDDIERLEAIARDILEGAGLPVSLVCGSVLVTELVTGRELTPEWHAAHILFYAHATRQHIEAGDAKMATWTAMRLQDQADQLVIRAIELQTRMGMRLLANASRPKYTPEEKQAWTRMADAIKAQHPAKSVRNIATIIAQRLGVPAESIRQHLKTRAKG